MQIITGITDYCGSSIAIAISSTSINNIDYDKYGVKSVSLDYFPLKLSR